MYIFCAGVDNPLLIRMGCIKRGFGGGAAVRGTSVAGVLMRPVRINGQGSGRTWDLGAAPVRT
jgi:hypothetical protein